MVSLISDGKQTVSSLIDLIDTWVSNGFPLMQDGTVTGKHHKLNYKSALGQHKQGTHNSLLKRLMTGKTMGPFAWSGSVEDLPFTHCAINPIGAVPYKYEPDRARACDDPIINDAITATHFKMPAMQMLRDDAYPGCSWLKSDIAAAFPTMNVAQQDLVWMMFAWFAPEDTTFSGTDQDCLYLHTYGNFGPRPWPYEFTMLMLFVNISAYAHGIDLPAAFIDDNIHTGQLEELKELAPKYQSFLIKARMPDKAAKRELLDKRGDLLGRWFNSISMTLSIPQDKLVRLTQMLLDHKQDRVSATRL